MPAISNYISSIATSELSLAGAPLTVRVSARARRLRLRVDARAGGLVLTVPPGVSRRRALNWAAGHEAWAQQALQAVPQRQQLIAGSTILYRGVPCLIVASGCASRHVEREDDAIHVGGPSDGLEGRLLRWMKREALALLTAETAELAKRLAISGVRVGVGDPRSRWGSCSSAKAVRYSWRLIMAPDFVRRATVAHEAAHLVHMDHSSRFHALLRELLGHDPKPARDWLRREGAGLHRIGAAR